MSTPTPIPDRLRRVLIVDDEENIRHLLLMILRRAGYEPAACSSGEEALDRLGDTEFGVVICDIRMPGMSGEELLQQIMASAHGPYVAMMSAYGGVETALRCMKQGAYDYFNKPFKADEVVLLLQKVGERERLYHENQRLRDELDERSRLHSIVCKAATMRSILGTIEKVAPYDTTVLITGESGTGKELLARALHRSSGRVGALVPVNCGAIPEALLESELFGHARGAFTGANKTRLGMFREAEGGTLFLDEIGELPLALQVKLLRALESGEVRPVGESIARPVDVRVVAATSRDLEARAHEGSFREDLLYRLNVLHVQVPPLRERREDIPLLVEEFVERLNRKLGRQVQGVEAAAMDLLLAYNWPGNVRELENAIERAMILSEADRLVAGGLPPRVSRPRPGPPALQGDQDLSIKRRLPDLEARLIREALRRTGGNRTHASRMLQISHRALLYKMKDYGIDVPAPGQGT